MFVWTIILCSYLVIANSVRTCMRNQSTRCRSATDVLGMYGILCVRGRAADTGDDTRQALLVTPLWFIALGLGGCLLVRSGLLNCGNNRIIMRMAQCHPAFRSLTRQCARKQTLFSRLMCSIRSSISSLMPFTSLSRWCRLPAAV